MAELNTEELKKLKPFFRNLEAFRNPKAQFVTLRDGTTVNRAACLRILRSHFSFEGLTEQQIKDDNFLVNYLTKNKFNQNKLLNELSPNEKQELLLEIEEGEMETSATKAAEEQPVTEDQPPPGPAGESAETMETQSNQPHTPSLPHSNANRPTRRRPSTSQPEETKKLYTANKSGFTTGEYDVGPHGLTPSKPEGEAPKIQLANKSGTVIGERSLGATPTSHPQPTETPKIQLANKSGAILGSGEPQSSKIVLTNSSGAPIGEHTVNPAPRPRLNLGGFKVPNVLKNIGSRAGIFFQRNAGKFLTPMRLATAVSGSIGALTGGAVMAGSPPAIFGGAALGGAVPFWVKNGGAGRFLKNAENKFSHISRISQQFGRGGGGSFGKSFQKKWRRRLILMFLGSFLLSAAIAGVAGLFTTGGNGRPTNPGGSGPTADISSCTFTGAGQSKAFASPVFSGIMSQTATKAGIPPAVLATVISHENSDFRNALDTHDAIRNDYYYFVNPEGTTRAVGLGQISVGRTTIGDRPENMAVVDHCRSLFGGVIQRAATNLGKQIRDADFYCVDDVNERVKRFCQTDYFALSTPKYAPQDSIEDGNYLNLCRVKDNLAVSAAKLSDNIGSGSWNTDTDLKLSIRRYYGACSYPGGNYCDEALTDYKNCQPSAPSAPAGPRPPAPEIDPSGYRQDMIDKFGITLNGFDNDHLKWAREKLYEVSSTKFIALVRGSVAEQRVGSERKGCPGGSLAIYLEQYPNEALFKYTLIHEFGHVIRDCHDIPENLYDKHMNAYKAEKGATYYSNNAKACGSYNNEDEDYAEMIALYLNPGANIHMAKCTPGGTKYPNLVTDFPIHYNVAKDILGNF